MSWEDRTMSTKIWTAYKLKDPSKLTEVTHDLRLKGQANLRKVLKKQYDQIINDPEIINSETYKDLIKESYYDSIGAKVVTAQRHITQKFKEASNSPYRELYDFELSVSFYFFEGNIYLIPHADMLASECFNFIKRDKRFVDYHYQNQCDRARGITKKEWSERERVWDTIYKQEGFQNSLQLMVCTGQNFYRIDPYLDIRKKYNRKKKSK